MSKIDAAIGLVVMVVLLVIIVMDPHNWPPCPSEDSNECYWDGGPNGEGDRFIAVNDTFIIRL